MLLEEETLAVENWAAFEMELYQIPPAISSSSPRPRGGLQQMG